MQILTQNGLVGLDEPVVMAILNCTPDSFVASTRLLKGCGAKDANWQDRIVAQAQQALEAGATILDIGGYSTRPGAAVVGEEEEWQRVELALRAIRSCFPRAVLSVDTFRPAVARYVVEEYGVDIINDISGGSEEMYETVARLGVAYILMHMRGTPQTMQQMTDYGDVMAEMMAYFQERLDRLHRMGVADVVIDPGFGFAKTVEQNYQVLRRMYELEVLGCPILAGLSRKSMLYKPLEITAEEALNATTAVNMLALQQGAKILRVHDVREAAECIKIWKCFDSRI